MRRAAFFLGLLGPYVLAGCSGGGGGGGGVATPARLMTTGVEFGPASTAADLVISLQDLPTPAPVLLQVTIDLPAAVAVASNAPLAAVQATPTLRGAMHAGGYRVVCGDDRNPAGQPLQNGELFRVRLVTTQPRQNGQFEIVLRDLKAALGDGTPAAIDTNPITATANVR